MITVKTPARICLFGEHQDYLDLPVIAQTIPLYSQIKGQLCEKKIKGVTIHLIDMDQTEYIFPEDLLKNASYTMYTSGMKLCMQKGLTFSSSMKIEVTSAIPSQAGCSSSSSIMIGWIKLLMKLADNPVSWEPVEIAEAAYQAEVMLLNGQGGRMDQYTIAMDQLIYMATYSEISVQSLPPIPGAFVLGDSMEVKNTQAQLRRCKESRIKLFKHLKEIDPKFSIHTIQCKDTGDYRSELNKMEILDLFRIH